MKALICNHGLELASLNTSPHKAFTPHLRSADNPRPGKGDHLPRQIVASDAPSENITTSQPKQIMKLISLLASILFAFAFTVLPARAKVGILSGPFIHNNLQVFLIHGDTQ